MQSIKATSREAGGSMRWLRLSHAKPVFLVAVALLVVVSSVVQTRMLVLREEEPSHNTINDLPLDPLPTYTAETPRHSHDELPLLSLFPAMQVWENYKQWHSHEALLRQPDHRSFIVGYYSCPMQAGNRLHDFWNSLIVAAITNRTLLWKYFDSQTCQRVNQGYNSLICKHNSTERDCATSLTRADWIPSYDEWALPLGLHRRLPVRNPDYRIGKVFGSRWFPSAKTKKKHPDRTEWTDEEKHPSKSTWLTGRLIQTSREWFLDEQVPKHGMKHRVLGGRNAAVNVTITSKNSPSSLRLEALYSEGVDFLYGMLHHDTFTYRGNEHLSRSPQDQVLASHNTNNGITIAMHSRHFEDKIQGKITVHEEKCLATVIRKARRVKGSENDNGPCSIVILSDRKMTLLNVSSIAQDEFNCTPVVASHDKNKPGSGLRNEHGPFAGDGFFQDLYYGAKARDGYIGHCGRSSSQLLQEVIVYNRRMEAWKQGNYYPPTRLSHCCLPSGYNYNTQLVADQ
jgi:hypothetical protein